jgi:hypothetical protein
MCNTLFKKQIGQPFHVKGIYAKIRKKGFGERSF